MFLSISLSKDINSYDSNIHNNQIEDLKKFTEDIMQNTYDIINNVNYSEDRKINESKKLLRIYLDLKWMPMAALGRYRKIITKQEIDQYKAAYKDYVVNSYTDLVKHYQDEKGEFKNIKKINDSLFLVKTIIVNKSTNSHIKVDYLVTSKGLNQYKVRDIITEGVSIIHTQKSEFSSIIGSKGINFLINHLSKTN